MNNSRFYKAILITVAFLFLSSLISCKPKEPIYIKYSHEISLIIHKKDLDISQTSINVVGENLKGIRELA